MRRIIGTLMIIMVFAGLFVNSVMVKGVMETAIIFGVSIGFAALVGFALFLIMFGSGRNRDRELPRRGNEGHEK